MVRSFIEIIPDFPYAFLVLIFIGFRVNLFGSCFRYRSERKKSWNQGGKVMKSSKIIKLKF